MTITKITDREIALQAQLAAMTASRDECQQAADKMAWDHKVERDKLRQHIKHIGNDALRSENHELRQQLASAMQLAQLNGEIGAELKADKLALETEVERLTDRAKNLMHILMQL